MLLAVLILIFRDLYTGSNTRQGNPCDYNLDKIKKIDSSLICYKEIGQFKSSLSKLYGIAVDSALNIFVAGDKEVQVFNKEYKKTGGFRIDSVPNCIALGHQKEVYLGIGNHVEGYNRNGKKIKSWKGMNSKGYITSIAVKGNEIYVADAGNRVVVRYNRDGAVLNQIGEKDPSKGIGGFIIPSMYFDVTIGADNDLWIANPGKHALENYSEDGELISSWGIASMQMEGFAGCCNPVHFSILPDGYFVTYEKGMDRIKAYNQTGKFECVVAGPTGLSSKPNYNCTYGTAVNDITVDSEGSVYVLDALSNMVRVYGKK
jgi:sugar lactone lactonase YvrE